MTIKTAHAVALPHGRRGGSVSVLVVLAVSALVGVMALTIDIGSLYVAEQQLQNAADAAALAGVAQMRRGPDNSAITAEVLGVAQSNSVLGGPVDITTEDVEIGYYDPDTGAWSDGWPHDGTPLVRVTCRRTANSDSGPIQMNFARMFGVESVDLEATATAGLSGGNIARDGVELAISQDASGSFVDELDDAKVADKALIDIVEDAVVEDDTSGVNKFRGEVQREIDLTSVGDEASQIRGAVDGIYYDSNMASGTHTALGIEDATDMLVNRPGGSGTSPVIVLVSDGMPFGYAVWEWQYTWRYHYYYGWYKDWYQVQTMTEEEHTEYRRQRAVEAADAAAAEGIKLHTVTFVQEPPSQYDYGQAGSDADFNASLVRNGGYAFHTPEPEDLEIILQCVGYIEVGRPMLIE